MFQCLTFLKFPKSTEEWVQTWKVQFLQRYERVQVWMAFWKPNDLIFLTVSNGKYDCSALYKSQLWGCSSSLSFLCNCFWFISGLWILNGVNGQLPQKQKFNLIRWVCSLAVLFSCLSLYFVQFSHWIRISWPSFQWLLLLLLCPDIVVYIFSIVPKNKHFTWFHK